MTDTKDPNSQDAPGTPGSSHLRAVSTSAHGEAGSTDEQGGTYTVPASGSSSSPDPNSNEGVADATSSASTGDRTNDSDLADDSGLGHESAPVRRRDRLRKRGIYLLPNLITSGALFAGFYAIVAGMNGDFIAASLAIFVAFGLDTADGRVARLTNTESEFGAEYDSLSDMVSFGVAPALILYDFALSELGRFGILVAFVYIACAALRLARFNVATISDKRFFTGMPSPGAAAMMISIIWVCVDSNINPQDINVALAITLFALGLAMVSSIKYRSFKDVDFRDKMPFIGLIILIVGIAMIYIDPPLAFVLIGTVYIVSGAVTYVSRMIRRNPIKLPPSDD